MTISTETRGSRGSRRRFRRVELALVLSLTLNGLMMIGILAIPHGPSQWSHPRGDEMAFGRDGAEFGPRGIPEHEQMRDDDLD
jgi:hypothetical protein